MLADLVVGDRDPTPAGSVEPPAGRTFQNAPRVRLDLVTLEIPVTQVEDDTVIAGQDWGNLSVKKTARLAIGRGDRDRVLTGRRPEDPAEGT
jgi:hypothetical protein